MRPALLGLDTVTTGPLERMMAGGIRQEVE
jgi:hypothetical protein